jgi:hypothetical protein
MIHSRLTVQPLMRCARTSEERFVISARRVLSCTGPSIICRTWARDGQVVLGPLEEVESSLPSSAAHSCGEHHGTRIAGHGRAVAEDKASASWNIWRRCSAVSSAYFIDYLPRRMRLIAASRILKSGLGDPFRYNKFTNTDFSARNNSSRVKIFPVLSLIS